MRWRRSRDQSMRSETCPKTSDYIIFTVYKSTTRDLEQDITRERSKECSVKVNKSLTAMTTGI